jgi:hypothetical protein
MTPDDPRLPPPDDPAPDTTDPAAGRPGGPDGPGASGPSGDDVAGGGDGPDGPATGPGGSGISGGDADELASAMVDGVLDEAEAAAARQRPDVMARLAEIEATRAALRDAPAPPPDPAGRERAIAAALAAFDDGAAAPPAAGAPVRGVAARQHRRPAPRRGAARWLGAAAAVAVLAAAAAGLATLDTTSDNGNAATGDAEVATGDDADEAGQDASGGATEAPGPSGGGEEGTAERETAVPLAAGDLGTYESADDLVANLRLRAAQYADSTAATDGGGEAVAPDGDVLADLRLDCGSDLPRALQDGETVVRLRGTATLGGEPVDVLVINTPDGDRVVAVDAGCSIMLDVPLS